MIVGESQLEKAMRFLAESDAECAELKANVQRTEHLAKVAEALVFKLAEGNNEERKAYARVSGEVTTKWEQHFSAIRAYEECRARRERAVLTVDIYRTQAANRRAGA